MAFLTTADAHAQAYIGGRVVDRQQRTPLAHLTVELLGARDTVLHTAVSATDGTFTLVAPRGGAYRVRFVVDGIPTHVSDTLGIADGEYAAREFPLDMSQRPLPEKEVDKPVLPIRGSPQPRYPEELRRAGISGCVLAQFIVDTTGRADRGTMRVLVYSDREFVRAVWEAMPLMRFTPAEVRGRKVPQIVNEPFSFTIKGADVVNCTKPAKK